MAKETWLQGVRLHHAKYGYGKIIDVYRHGPIGSAYRWVIQREDRPKLLSGANKGDRNGWHLVGTKRNNCACHVCNPDGYATKMRLLEEAGVPGIWEFCRDYRREHGVDQIPAAALDTLLERHGLKETV